MEELRNAYKNLVSLKGRDHFGYIGLDGRIILKCILKCKSVTWVQLAQNRDQWWAVIYTVIDLGVP